MNAYQAKDLARQNSSQNLPKDILKDIKAAAKDGYLSIRFRSDTRPLTQLEISALRLDGYKVTSTKYTVYPKVYTSYVVSWR